MTINLSEAAEQWVEKYLEEHTIYDLFKCGICGKQWCDHTHDCFYHDKKRQFDELRQIASSMDKYKSVFEMARRNGYSEYPHVYMGITSVRDSNGHIL